MFKTSVLLLIASALVGIGLPDSAQAAKSTSQKQKKAKTSQNAAQKKKNLSTNVVFSGSSVDGKYHSAGEAVAQVEEEKDLNKLIGIRKNFRDRLAEERAQLAKEARNGANKGGI